MQPLTVVRGSDPDAASFHPDGINLHPGVVELVTAESTAPGERHEHLAGEEGKVGSSTSVGWVGQWSDDATFIKQFTPVRGAQYPDGGCTIELYTCEYFIELETLSPLATMAPGESITHEERWYVSKPISNSPVPTPNPPFVVPSGSEA